MTTTAVAAEWGALSVVALFALSGCGGRCESRAVVCDTRSGGATLQVPGGIAAAPTMRLQGSQSCLDVSGGCTLTPSFLVASTQTRELPAAVSVSIALPVVDGSATYDLLPPSSSGASAPSDRPTLQAWLSPAPVASSLDFVSLAVTSGTLNVEGAGVAGFRATFEMRLETPDHLELVVTDGAVTLDGCGVLTSTSSCAHNPAD